MIEKRIPPLWESRAVDYPLAREVLDHASSLVAHSRYVATRAREMGFRGPIALVPHAAWPAPEVEPAVVEGAPVIAAFGNLNASKRAPQLLEAVARLRRAHPSARLLLVGAPSPGFDVERRMQRLGLDGAGVELTGFVDEGRLWALMAAADVHVNLRSISRSVSDRLY